jgi:hypothetical protein
VFPSLFSNYIGRVELHILSGIKEVQFLHKLKPVLYVSLVITTLVNTAAAIFRAANRSSAGFYIYNAVFAVFLVAFIIGSLYYGVQLRLRIKRIWKKTKVQGFKYFLYKVTGH